MINLILKIVLVAVFGTFAVLGGAAQGSDLPGIIALCAVLLWLSTVLFEEVRSYLIGAILLVGSAAGLLAVKSVPGLSAGYLVSLTVVFLFLGVAMVAFKQRLNLFFLSKVKLPVAAWVVLVLVIDILLSLGFMSRDLGLKLLEVRAGALLGGVVVAIAAKFAFAAVSKSRGDSALQLVFIKEVATAAKATKPKRTKAPKESGRKQSGSTVSPAPAIARKKPSAASAKKASVLDAKLEALCSGGGTTKKAPAPKPSGAENKPAEEKAEEKKEDVPKSNETGKIVSSVDFS
jgi:hypothetical protein